MRIIEGWTWQQALAFTIAFAVVCGPLLYLLWNVELTCARAQEPPKP